MLSSRQYVEGGGGKQGGRKGGVKNTRTRDRDIKTTTRQDGKGSQRS